MSMLDEFPKELPHLSFETGFLESKGIEFDDVPFLGEPSCTPLQFWRVKVWNSMMELEAKLV